MNSKGGVLIKGRITKKRGRPKKAECKSPPKAPLVSLVCAHKGESNEEEPQRRVPGQPIIERTTDDRGEPQIPKLPLRISRTCPEGALAVGPEASIASRRINIVNGIIRSLKIRLGFFSTNELVPFSLFSSLYSADMHRVRH